jgi:hypothetical protein
VPFVLTNKEADMTKRNTKTTGMCSAASKPAPSAKAKAKRPTKADRIINLLCARKGASIAEMQKATGWQAHSVRGFLSGTVRKRMELTLASEPDKSGVRRYRIVKGDPANAG